MLPNVQNQVKDRPYPVPKDAYKPFSFSVLTKEIVDYAAANLNETEEVREKSLQELREYIEQHLGIHHKIHDIYLLCYLRSRKFDMKRTCLLAKKTLEFAQTNTKYFDSLDAQTLRRVIDSNIIGFLPFRDSKSRAIVLVTSENWDPQKIKPEELIFGSIVALYAAVNNPVTQILGVVLILSFKTLKMQQAVAMSTWLIFGIQALQRCCPIFVKEIHILHVPAFFRNVWKLVKPLLSEKLRKRIIFYKSDGFESLHRRIPPAILPEELGGHLEPFSNNHWAVDMNVLRHFNETVRIFWKTPTAVP